MGTCIAAGDSALAGRSPGVLVVAQTEATPAMRWSSSLLAALTECFLFFSLRLDPYRVINSRWFLGATLSYVATFPLAQ